VSLAQAHDAAKGPQARHQRDGRLVEPPNIDADRVSRSGSSTFIRDKK